MKIVLMWLKYNENGSWIGLDVLQDIHTYRMYMYRNSRAMESLVTRNVGR